MDFGQFCHEYNVYLSTGSENVQTCTHTLYITEGHQARLKQIPQWSYLKCHRFNNCQHFRFKPWTYPEKCIIHVHRSGQAHCTTRCFIRKHRQVSAPHRRTCQHSFYLMALFNFMLSLTVIPDSVDQIPNVYLLYIPCRARKRLCIGKPFLRVFLLVLGIDLSMAKMFILSWNF